MDRRRIKYVALLFLTAMIWGTAFVFQSEAADDVGPFTFNAARMLVAGVALLPVVGFMDRFGGAREKPPRGGRACLIGGVCCGALLAAASAFQQAGIGYTSVGKAGFITALYIVMVPLFGLLTGRRVGAKLYAGVALAAAGMYLLCMGGETGVNKGDMLCLACAALFSGHILCIDHFSPGVDGVKMSCVQFFVCAALSAVMALIFEKPDAASLHGALFAILYAGVLSSAVGYTLQIVAQSKVNPTLASLVMSLESVFSALAGWVLLGQSLSGREILGCVMMFAAIVLAQLKGGAKERG